jgi:hypothetical protein
LVAALLAAAQFSISGAAEPEARFAGTSIRILTMGETQTLREAGIFSAHLPLGKPAELLRRLKVENASRGTRLDLGLRLLVKPVVGEDGVLRLLLLSESTPEGGEVVSRAREMAFTHEGEQVMEAFVDVGTGTRVVYSVSASLDEAPPPARSPLPPLLFLVRVEKWIGAHRVELEALQLQSLEGMAVSHHYERRVPRWTDGAPSEGEKDWTEGLPVIQPGGEPPQLKAGQSFSIPLEPEVGGKKKGRDRDKAAGDLDVPAPEPPPRKVVWETEQYDLTLTPLSLEAGRLRLKAEVEGRMLSPSKEPLAPLAIEDEKSLLAGEPAPFYLTREGADGPLGYVVWVIPRWEEVGSPGAAPTPPPAPTPTPGFG